MAKKRLVEVEGRVNTTALVSMVAAEAGISQEDAHKAVIAAFSIVLRAVASGHDVALTNFGTFTRYRTKDRPARNPVTGETMTVPSRWWPTAQGGPVDGLAGRPQHEQRREEGERRWRRLRSRSGAR
jgi:nucleoid DNA-binding protein